ncbi:MAG: hypothetical protein MR454_01480, partial [Solobacterium sp.]|nr:hypothetical protein [Solobacterium sp.]
DTYWDSNLMWLPGAGSADPGISDEIGEKVFTAEYVIPYGERLLSGIGIGAWSGAVDFENHDDISYYANLDYYNMKSNENLTMLTGYKTRLQPSGWSCGMSSLLTVLEWYGLRGGLNDYDLANLRHTDEWAAGTPIDEMYNVIAELNGLGIIGDYEIKSWLDDPEALFDPEFVKSELSEGHPIMVLWNAYGWHWQVIIGYDDMGSEGTNDDVLIMMDPYDTTDQNANGYYLEQYERLIYGVNYVSDDESTNTQYVVFAPEGFEYTPVMGEVFVNASNNGNFTDDNKMPYGNTAADIQKYYPDTMYLGDNGLAGAATGGYERSGDHNNSPYWMHPDFYNMESTDSLKILTNFETLQQSEEWTCGLTSSLMVLNWFGMAEDETDVSLATHRQNGATGATYLDGMIEVFDYINEQYNRDFVYITTYDLDDMEGEESYVGDYCLQAGTQEDWYGLIPYFLENGIPVMVGSDEWGGHWQVIIGYDDMGTIDRTEDDVIVLADAYDTTDHNQDGYVIDSFERLVYGWYSSFEDEIRHNNFIAAFPASQYQNVVEELIGITG